eukprot:TRINITY_DN3036_c0_g1_i1.p1 TRINITY_DN3036_c0_g1~~TRINITY_DN3036_c0_g1_i1.p1  ORF type:complete len:426 (+),score=41.50 TRINITY_DN3036_c0_g1_i1:208-1485(+)
MPLRNLGIICLAVFACVGCQDIDLVEGDWFITVFAKDLSTNEIIPNLFINYTFSQMGSVRVPFNAQANMTMNLFKLDTLVPQRWREGNTIYRRATLPTGIVVTVRANLFNESSLVDYFGWGLRHNTRSIKLTFTWDKLKNDSSYPGDATGWQDPFFYYAMEASIEVASILSNETHPNLYLGLYDLLYQEPVGVINCSTNPVWNYVPMKVCSGVPITETFRSPPELPTAPTYQTFTIVDQRLNITIKLLENFICTNSSGDFFSTQFGFRFFDGKRNLSDLAYLQDLMARIFAQHSSPDRYGVISVSGISYLRPSVCNADSVSYDPDLLFLFDSGPRLEGSNPSNGNFTVENASSGTNVPVAIGVTLGVVATVAVVLAIVSAAHPALRARVYPWLPKRNEEQAPLTIDERTGAEATKPNWKVGKPDQ